jgi:hypothetical protein
MGIKFPTVKLLDYRSRWAELEASDSPFATVVMAHLKSLDTRADPKDRRSWKMKLLRPLYEKGLDGDAIRGLFQFIDMVMLLPPALDSAFINEVEALEEEKKMPFITSAERVGRERGRQQGRQEGLQKAIEVLLKTRFGRAGARLMARVNRLQDEAVLEQVLQGLGTANKLGEVEQLLPPK